MVEPRTAKEIIDQAIRDNRAGEIITYSFAIAFVLVGIGTLVVGIIRSNPLIALSGAISGSLFIPAMNATRRTRRENITMRLLEAPLSRAGTAEEAAAMLQRAFADVFVADDQRQTAVAEAS